MKYLQLLLVLVIFVLLESTFGQDYCDAELCPKGATHIACNNTGEFGPKCPELARLANLGDDKKQGVLDQMNTFRNEIASGNVTGFEPAVRMKKLTWSDNIAFIAALSAKRCEFKLDECRNTKEFQQAAELIYLERSKENINHRNHLFRFIEWAYEGHRFANADKMANFTRSGTDYSRFAILANDRVDKVGLNTVAFKSTILNVLSCLIFSSRNIVGSHVYRAGPPASECQTGTDPQYPSLCSANENIDPNAP